MQPKKLCTALNRPFTLVTLDSCLLFVARDVVLARTYNILLLSSCIDGLTW